MGFPQVGLPFSAQTSQATLTIDQDPVFAQYAVATNATGFTATAPQVAGAQDCVLRLTGTLGSGQNIQLPTAASIIAVIPSAALNAYTNYNYYIRIVNSSAGNFSWTVTTNTGITLNGTTGVATIAQNAQRTFLVMVTGNATVTVQDTSA